MKQDKVENTQDVQSLVLWEQGRNFSGRNVRVSLKLKVMFMLFALVTLFITIMLLVNTIFLEPYYKQQQEKKLNSCFEQVTSLDFSDSQAYDKLLTLEENENIQILIITSDRVVFYCSSPLNDSLFIPDGKDGEQWFMDWLMPEEEKGNSVEIFSTKPGFGTRINPSLAASYLSLYAKADMPYNGENESFYIIINTPLAAIEQGIEITNRFALIVGAVLIVLCGASTYVIGTMITDPIVKVSAAAKRISHMDFGQTVEYSSNDELGELADSVNDLSAQLRNKIMELSVANQRLRQQLLQRERIDNMRRQFISDVSHELKTPLAIIRGYCEGLQLNVNNDEKDYYCGVIEDETIKMSNLAARLLDLAELESGEWQPEMNDFSLTELAHDRLFKLKPLLEERSIKTEFVCDGSYWVKGDSERIEEVLNNLLTNARNHTPDGGVVRVSLDSDGENVSCVVYNSGSHIPEDSIDKIWESFYKVDKARTRAYGGSGLGLKIVSTILDMHKSSYGARNTDNGVEFYFKMKLSPPDDEWDAEA